MGAADPPLQGGIDGWISPRLGRRAGQRLLSQLGFNQLLLRKRKKKEGEKRGEEQVERAVEVVATCKGGLHLPDALVHPPGPPCQRKETRFFDPPQHLACKDCFISLGGARHGNICCENEQKIEGGENLSKTRLSNHSEKINVNVMICFCRKAQTSTLSYMYGRTTFRDFFS